MRRVPAAAGSTAVRGLSTSCYESSSLEEAPFGHPLPADSESEEDEMIAAMAGGTVLFGQNKVRDWASPVSKPPTAASLGPARWIGSTTHSGDYTRASLKQQQPAASSGDTVWGQVPFDNLLTSLRTQRLHQQQTAPLHIRQLFWPNRRPNKNVCCRLRLLAQRSTFTLGRGLLTRIPCMHWLNGLCPCDGVCCAS